MKLLIVHYHLRPGGIRRIIESATPFLLAEIQGSIEEVVLATGEAKDRLWNSEFAKRLRPVPVRFVHCPAFGYVSESRVSAAALREEMRRTLRQLLDGSDHWLVWAHNPGVGRNLILAEELVRACERRSSSLLFHHHDWWFDNRWQRWSEMRRFGFRTLRRVAVAVFSAAASVRHVVINRKDAAVLRSGFPARAHWVPNLTERKASPSARTQKEARQWLGQKFGIRDHPVWIVPCRLLRRKNIAEAILLARWLQPEAWLITTGGVSSAQEQAYARKLNLAIQQNQWRVALGVLEAQQAGQPSVATLIAASETVLLTSIQEGFGLPYLEAVAAARPLIAREIPNVTPDLYALGFRLAHSYAEIRIAKSLFDAEGEQKRQERLFQQWRAKMPRACWKQIERPDWLRADHLPFSRLTLTAQIEVLSQPTSKSWDLSRRLNPFLPKWRCQTLDDRLRADAWPSRATEFLSGPAYAKRLAALFASPAGGRQPGRICETIQNRFFKEKLEMNNLFPLLWAEET